MACAAQLPAAARFLLDCGLDPRARNAVGDTPLHCVYRSVRSPSDERAMPCGWHLQPAVGAEAAFRTAAELAIWLGSHPPACEGSVTTRLPHRDELGEDTHGGSGRGCHGALAPLVAALLLTNNHGVLPMANLCAHCHTRFCEATASSLQGPGKPPVPVIAAGGNVKCTCMGTVWTAAQNESMQRCMLLVPDGLRAPGRAGGVLGALRCQGPLRAGSAGGGNGGLDGGAGGRGETGGAAQVLLSDLPLDVRVRICSYACLCPVTCTW